MLLMITAKIVTMSESVLFFYSGLLFWIISWKAFRIVGLIELVNFSGTGGISAVMR